MRIVAAGVSGYLGKHLVARLKSNGHQVTRLVRRRAVTDEECEWDPYARQLDLSVMDGVDAVINLGGAGVAAKRWTDKYKRSIADSRIIPTTVIAEAVATTKVQTLLNASAVGWYGDTGDTLVTETAPASDDFLGHTCQSWEDSTRPASDAGARVVKLRTGHVMSSDSVMLKKLLPLFKLGLGGQFGNGRQYFPWVSLLDWLNAVEFALTQDIEGPMNVTGPQPATNSDFTTSLAANLHRPAFLVFPAFALKIGAGEAASELLRGAKVAPRALLDNGFTFTHQTIDEALAWAIGSG